ncbi:MAG: putative viral replication protein [Cressdnaviricota sp.]|nr:MAG: putative viral replication protein [Cressdnaviricota sp.]
MSENSSNSSNEKGNTNSFSLTSLRQISPAKRWCFTLNNYSTEEYSSIVLAAQDACVKYIIGKEISESGTPHLQGFIRFEFKKRPKSIFNNERIHWEKCRGNDKVNFRYCSKENNYISHGFPKPIKVINPDRDWEIEILKIIKEEPDDRSIYWYWSKEGNVGKTAFCKYLTVKHEAIALSGKGADVRNGICEHLKHKGETPNLVVFPIPRSYNSDYLSYESIENIKDMYFYSGKYEGGMVCGNAPHLFIFSNNEPDYDKLSEDRWIVREIF